MKNLQQQVRNEAERLSERAAAVDNEAGLGGDLGFSPVQREYEEEPFGRIDENQPLGGGMVFGDGNNDNYDNPLRNDYGQF